MSRANAVPDVGGVGPIVVKIMEGGVSVLCRMAVPKANTDPDLADHPRTLKSVRVLASCARRYHLSAAIFVAKGNWFSVPVVSARNSAVLTAKVVLSVKVVKQYWPPLVSTSTIGIWR